MLLKGKRVKISRAIFRQALFTFFTFLLLNFVLTNIIFFSTFTPSNRGKKKKVCVGRHLALPSAITYSR